MTGLKAYDVTVQEPMADQVITMEPKLSLSFCLVLFIFNKYSEFLASVKQLDC
jgi:hypothetical protein